MGTAQLSFAEVERGGATWSHVTGSDVSHVTGSGPDRKKPWPEEDLSGSDGMRIRNRKLGNRFPCYFLL